ncbi:hypothetical protein GURASL_16110 [Geotalea uraniireducens]|uniref:DUF4935 domain-containing protein n=1 Tax=Geotalea uraniireducens TaxID=351604 RepID=A0ABN6VQW3_9BACT|nr:PIN domain-containing protein [Geotalea uraniireducens]BDV42688.1 hypothetical protein GURASL_16110 [Geotalea uraniireducens]
MYIEVDEVCAAITARPAPVLFLDTCTILDVLRAPCRETIAVEEISAALALIRLNGQPTPGVWLVTNETVHGEWTANLDTVKTELERESKKIERLRSRLVDAVDIVYGRTHEVGHRIEHLKLSEHLENLSRQLVSVSQKVKIVESHSVNAMNRVIRCLAPAGRGKQEAKDCQIYEAFLDVGRTLRTKGFAGSICFVTANSDDYGKPTEPKNPLGAELLAINARYVGSLSWALAVVEGRG